MKKFYSQGGKLSAEIKNFYGDGINYSTIMKLLRKKQVKVNGVRTGKDTPTRKGDFIEAYFDGLKRELKIIYEDENLVVCYKKEGIASEDFYASVKEKYPTAGFIHRLDRNTDGIMVFSLNDMAERELLKGFKNRTFEKYYLAEVYGALKPEEATLTAYLKKDEERAEVKIFPKREKGSEKIITGYKTLKKGEETSLLEIRLITGKTHQIRAHMSFIGHFIIGDGKYGDERINRKFKKDKQSLTAYKIVFGFEKESPLSYLDGKEIISEEGRLRSSFAKNKNC